MMIIIKSWFILITFLWPVTQRLTLNKAKEQLQSEFNRLLLRCSNPTTPIDVLNLIGPDEVLGIQRDDVGIPSPVLQELVSISTWCLEDHSSFGNGIRNPLLHSLIEKWVKVTQMMPVFFSSSQEILRSLIGSLLLFFFFCVQITC